MMVANCCATWSPAGRRGRRIARVCKGARSTNLPDGWGQAGAGSARHSIVRLQGRWTAATSPRAPQGASHRFCSRHWQLLLAGSHGAVVAAAGWTDGQTMGSAASAERRSSGNLSREELLGKGYKVRQCIACIQACWPKQFQGRAEAAPWSGVGGVRAPCANGKTICAIFSCPYPKCRNEGCSVDLRVVLLRVGMSCRYAQPACTMYVQYVRCMFVVGCRAVPVVMPRQKNSYSQRP